MSCDVIKLSVIGFLFVTLGLVEIFGMAFLNCVIQSCTKYVSCVDVGVVCDTYVGHMGVRIMCYFDAELCFLWIFICKLHNFNSWL